MHRLADVVPPLLALVTGTIVVAAAIGDPTLTIIPLWAWVACLALHCIAISLVTLLVMKVPEPLAYAALATASLTAMTLAVTAPGAGWIMIQLVFVASTSAYLVPLGVTMVIIAIQSGAVVASTWLSGQSTSSIAIGLLIYGLLQLSSVVFVRIVLREQEQRAAMEVANVRLLATQELLRESTRSAERVRIARDIHDVLGHQLTALSLELEAAMHAEPIAARRSVERAREAARSLLEDVRETVSAMRVERVDLRDSLAAIADGVRSPRVHLDVQVEHVRGERVVETLVRAVQEIVTNAIRHAEADEVWIRVRAHGDGIVLDAHDDGPGVAAVLPGNGLTGLRERVESLGGELSIEAARGFPVRATVPA